MKNLTPRFVRWLVWLVVVSLEAVIGFPWLSVFLAFEWVLAMDREKTVLILAIMSVVLAGATAAPWSLVVGVLLGMWQAAARTRPRTWQRTAVWVVGAALLGYLARVPITTLTVLATLFAAGGVWIKTHAKGRHGSWQKMK